MLQRGLLKPLGNPAAAASAIGVDDVVELMRADGDGALSIPRGGFVDRLLATGRVPLEQILSFEPLVSVLCGECG